MRRSKYAGRAKTGAGAIALVGAALAAAVPAQAATSSRATARLSDFGASVPLARSLPNVGVTASWLNAASLANSSQALISIQHRDQAGLLNFISAVSNPKSPLYRHYLTSQQFDARYAPTDATMSTVEKYLTTFGLKVTEVPANRAFVRVSGNVGEMERAFNTTIDSYERAGVTYQAPRATLNIPAKLANVITGITGLDTGDIAVPTISTGASPLTFTPVSQSASNAATAKLVAHDATNTASCVNVAPATPTLHSAADATKTPPTAAYVNAPPFSTSFDSCASTAPAYNGQSLGDVVQGYTPAQLEGAYGVSGAIAAGLNGAGESVAVIDAYSSPTIQQDASEWSKNMGLPAPSIIVNDTTAEESSAEGPALPTDVPIVGGVNLLDPSGWFGEETLDVEAVHAMAPGAQIVMQGSKSASGTDLEDSQNAVVMANQVQEISNSYGGAGGGEDSTDATSDGYWQQAAAQGIGVQFSAGDDGDNTSCGTDDANAGLDGDSNSPYVTNVGGTTLAVGATNNYEWETYWGEQTADLTNGAWGTLSCDGGGGGGVSQAYAEPSYQQSVVPASIADYWKGNPNAGSAAAGGTDPVIPGRVAPDVSMLGDPNSGFLMGQTQDFSVTADQGVALATDQQAYDQYRIGGTSLSSPLFAGVMALADQAAGKPVGFANPALYALFAKNAKAFHDPDTTAPVAGIVRTNYTDTTGQAGDTAANTSTVLRTFNNLGTLKALAGYDDSTGLGSPNGLTFLCGLAPSSTILKSLAGSPCATATTSTGTKTGTTTTTVTKTVTKTTCKIPSRYTYVQHPAYPVRETKAVVYVNGKKVRTVKGKRIVAINVNRPKTTKATIQIVSTLTSGEVISHTVSYNGCKVTSTKSKVLKKPYKKTKGAA